MDAAGEVFALHGMVLRLLCEKLVCHFDGISSAARAAFRAGILSGARKRKNVELDVTYHMVRHITAASSRNFVANLSAKLQSVAPCHGETGSSGALAACIGARVLPGVCVVCLCLCVCAVCVRW